MRNPKPLDYPKIEQAIQPLDLDDLVLMVEMHCENAKPEWKTKMIKKEIKEAIKSVLEFYFKYKGKPAVFVKENPESKEYVDTLWDKWKSMRPTIHSAKEDFLKEFNDRLLRYAFKEAIE